MSVRNFLECDKIRDLLKTQASILDPDYTGMLLD